MTVSRQLTVSQPRQGPIPPDSAH